MTHDDLCPQAYPYGRDDDLDSFFGRKDWDCRCELISTVRLDIASKIIQYGKDTHIPHSPYTACQRCDIVAAYNYAAEIARGN